MKTNPIFCNSNETYPDMVLMAFHHFITLRDFLNILIYIILWVFKN